MCAAVTVPPVFTDGPGTPGPVCNKLIVSQQGGTPIRPVQQAP